MRAFRGEELAPTAEVTVEDDGTLNLGGSFLTIQRLSLDRGAGQINTRQTFTVNDGPAATDATLSGVIDDFVVAVPKLALAAVKSGLRRKQKSTLTITATANDAAGNAAKPIQLRAALRR